VANFEVIPMLKELTFLDRTALLDEAVWAWSHASGRPHKLHFSWREKPFVSSIDPVSVEVETLAGEPVAVRHYY
jgi:hypothetical protein